MDRRGFVIRCYLAIYNNNQAINYNSSSYRTPDRSGWNFWVGNMQTDMANGKTLYEAKKGVVGGFVSSPEWTSRVGNRNNSSFVDFLYTNILGRAPDPSGKAFHLDKLDRGVTSRRDLILVFINSPEAVTRFSKMTYVCSAYLCELNRKADSSGFTFYTGQMTTGNLTPVGFYNLVHGSAEYRNRIAGLGCPWPASSRALSASAKLSTDSGVMAYNLIQVSKASTLQHISLPMNADGAAGVYFEVYEYTGGGLAALVTACDVVEAAKGGTIKSPRLGLALEPGKLYAVGARWQGSGRLSEGAGSDKAPLGISYQGSLTGTGSSPEGGVVSANKVLPIAIDSTPW